MNFLFSVLRWIFSRLDYIVIFVITQLYSLLVQIMDTNVFNDLIYKYLGRIYTFLGVFMVFKLSLSIINYVINPDMLSDKSKGFSKLITNVVISLILLAITPNLFNAAFNLQTDILKSNAIYQIVTGRKLEKNMTDEDSDFNPNNQAKLIAYGVYSSFIYKDLGDDKDLSKVNDPKDMYAECKEGTTGCDSNTTCSGKNPYCLVAADTVTKAGEDGKDFANTYWFLISTACGGFVAYILLTFCIDASLRAVKLGFLQIIAPIPIMSMIDPKVGNDKVMKWGKECLMTFIDLFIKLAGLFFAVDVITAVISSDGMVKYSDASAVTNPFVKLFVIIGCLMFAKKLPSMLESILGIKLSGGDGFSLKKRLSGAVGGAALIAGGAMAGRALAGVGKLGANTLGASARLGASSLKNKLTGKDNSAAVDRFKQRMSYSGQEAKGRFTSLNKKYSGDTMSSLYKKNSTGEREAEKKYEKGEKLWQQAEKNGKYSIYSSESFKNAAQLMDAAKDRRNKASEAYDIAQTQFQRGQISQEEFSKIRLASIDAQSDFDKAKAAFDEQSAIHTSDSEKYKLYSATADRKKAEAHINSPSSSSSSSTGSSSSSSSGSATSSSSSSSSGPTVGGVSVSEPNKNGERTTASGIILPSGVDVDK